MQISESRPTRGILVALVFACAFLSYAFNTFRVTTTDWFVTHQVDSEQLVLDGLLHAKQTGDVRPGRYSRPEIPDAKLQAHALYAVNETSGTFKPYESQYGLQMRVFAALAAIGVDHIGTLQAITALLTSAVVAALFALLWTQLGRSPALIFALVLVLSPWVVVFARNLYWVPFTWFLPMLVTLSLSSVAFARARVFWLMLGALFVTFLVKSLCGYEYITTIYFAAITPIVYFGVKERISFTRMAIHVTASGVALVAAFALALGMHALTVAPDLQSGLAKISLVAKKRVALDDPAKVAREVCEGSVDCENLTISSLRSSTVSVVATYFLMPDAAPWLSNFRDRTPCDSGCKAELKAVLQNEGRGAALKYLRDLGPGAWIEGVGVAVRKAVDAFGFIAFVLVVCVSFRRFPRELRAAVAVAFVAPLSWHVMAKAHSDVHTHMNYVLWYLPFIPLAAAALVTAVQRRQSRVP